MSIHHGQLVIHGAVLLSQLSHILISPIGQKKKTVHQLTIELDSLLNPLPALHLADDFDIPSMGPQVPPHVFDILG